MVNEMNGEEEVSVRGKLEEIACNIGQSKEGNQGWFLFI
jgi:hypothetical protein